MRTIYVALLVLALAPAAAFAAGPRGRDRAALREWVMEHARPSLTTIEPRANDLAEDLVDRLEFRNLARMEEAGLLRSYLEQAPWTDSYWPVYAGEIANRYADPHYNAAQHWQYNYEYLLGHLGQGPSEILSPAEKYDLLVGDANFTLTRRMIGSGAPYANAEGDVELWMGLCHGWAPAAMMLLRPQHAVTVPAADGRPLTFRPADLKALGTLLWANAPGETRYIGGRCNDRRPARDEAYRPKNPDCFDTNPGTWHLAVVNQIGVSHRAFLMDASAGYDVWNQPVVGYEYSYLDAYGRDGRSLAAAKTPRRELKDDPYAAHRSPRAEFIVRVVMAVTYVAENTPSLAATDGPGDDARMVATYSYDLELDGADNIVGGEWHSSLHPDFLWVPVAGAQALSEGDYWLRDQGVTDAWDGAGPVPETWRQAAQLGASREQPLARIVNALLEKAR